jgi:hypothetical protein
MIHPPRTGFDWRRPNAAGTVSSELVDWAARRAGRRNPRYDRITPARLRVLRQMADGTARQAREIDDSSPETLSRLVNLGLLAKDRAEDRMRQPWVYVITAAGRTVVERVAQLDARRASSRRRATRASPPVQPAVALQVAPSTADSRVV